MKSPVFPKSLMFIAGAIMLGLALTLSTFSALRAISAPLAAPPAPVTVPGTVGFEGFLTDDNDGQALDTGAYTMTFKIWDASANGTQKWSETQPNVQVTNGLYSAQLGSGTSFTADAFNGDRWIGVTVNLTGTEMSPRTKISSVPFALNADHANEVSNLSIDGNGNVGVSGGLSIGAVPTPPAGGLAMSGSINQSTAIAVRAYNHANLSIPNNQETLVTFNDENFDTPGTMHDTTSNTSRLVAPVEGTYLVTGQVSFAANQTGLRYISIRWNADGSCSQGTPIAGAASGPSTTSSSWVTLVATTNYHMNAGDRIEMCAYQASGAALNIMYASYSTPVFTLTRMP